MSDGLKLISSIIATGAAGALLQIDPHELNGNEVTVYEFVRGHYRAYRNLPNAATVQQETQVRLPVANEPLRYYLDKVEDRASYNLIRDHYQGLRDGMANRDMSAIGQAVDQMSRTLRTHRAGRTGEAIQINDAHQLVVDRLHRIRGSGGVSGVTTSWPMYDQITGGYQPSDLITLVARPSMGKTYLLLRQAQAAHEDGHNVLVVTTEMSAEQIARRDVALRLGIDPKMMQAGTLSTHMERRIRTVCQSMVGVDRYRVFGVGMKSKLDAVAALVEEFGPTIVYIDGVYLLQPTDAPRNASRTDRVAAVYDGLRALALDSNIPYVVTTQFNRSAGKAGKDGSLETIAFADTIGTHSSVVVAVRDGPTENPKDSRLLDFMKGREGESGQVAINFKFAPLDMTEMTPEERESEGEVTEESVAWMGVSRRA